RGVLLQGRMADEGERRVIGGKQVQRYRLSGVKGYLATGEPLPPQALVRPGSILVQNIVAHIAHPEEHIKIIGTVVGRQESTEIVILDTVNQLTNPSSLSSHFFLGLLHSHLINWYVYRFVFAKAIRTMHLDGPVSRRIPIPRLDLANPQDKRSHSRLAGL